MPPDYIDALQLPQGCLLVRSQTVFVARFLLACVRRRADLAFAPGPFVLRPGGRALAKSLGLLLCVLAARASGGKVVALGRSLRGDAEPVRRLERASVRLMTDFVSRDTLSAHVIGRPLRVAPDLAFGAPVPAASPPGERRVVAISLRYDRLVDPGVLAALVADIAAAGLRTVFTTQVRRDNAQHVRLAEQLGVDVCPWTTESPAEQLERVQRIYATAHTVVSNRLHAVIFGVLQGAVPVGITHEGSSKLEATLNHVVPMRYISSQEPAKAVLDLSTEPDGDLAETRRAVQRAHSDLEQLRAQTWPGRPPGGSLQVGTPAAADVSRLR